MEKYKKRLNLAIVVVFIAVLFSEELSAMLRGTTVMEDLLPLIPALVIFFFLWGLGKSLSKAQKSNKSEPYQELQKVFSKNPTWEKRFRTFQQGVTDLRNDKVQRVSVGKEHKPPFSSSPINRTVIVILLLILLLVLYILIKT